MKKILFTLAVLLSSFAAQAQEVPYQPLVVEGRTWVNFFQHYGEFIDNFHFYYTYKIQGDSVVNNVSYKKLYMTVSDEKLASIKCGCSTEDLIWRQNEVIALLREENMKVYAHFIDEFKQYIADHDELEYNETTNEFLLYDFGNLRKLAANGDLVQSQVLVGNSTCLGYNVDRNWEGVIESIGRSTGYATLINPNWVMTTCMDYNHIGLSHVLDGEGNIIYKSPQYQKYADYSGIDDVEVEKAKNDNQYYNIKGQVVDIKSAPAGLYIHNGKKVIVK